MGSAPVNSIHYTPKEFETRKNGRIKVQSAEVKDAAGISKLGSTVFSASFGYSMSAKDMDKYLEDHYASDVIEKELSDNNVHFLVAMQDEKVVGFVQLTGGPIEPSFANEPKPVELQRLYLYPELHGSGLAKFLVDEIIHVARCSGYQTMLLGVWEENFKAQAFYKKMGFHRVGEHDFTMGDCVQTDWILRMDL